MKAFSLHQMVINELCLKRQNHYVKPSNHKQIKCQSKTNNGCLSVENLS